MKFKLNWILINTYKQTLPLTITPKMKNSTSYIIIASILVAAVAIGTVVLISNQRSTQPRQDSTLPITNQATPENMTSQVQIQGLKKFNSVDELQKFLLDYQIQDSTEYN